MRKRFYMLLILMLFNTTFLFSRLFFIGSHPFFSIIAFPQDLMLFRIDSISYTISYQSLPWHGDVDEPENRPNESYTLTEQSISFVQDEKDTEKSWFNQSGSRCLIKNKIDLVYSINQNCKNLISLSYQIDKRENNAEGNLKAEEDDESYYVPFKYQHTQSLYKYYLYTILAFSINRTPIGIKLGYGKQDNSSMKNTLEATVNGTNIYSNRLLWGWTTVGCNKIFGFSHINGDAWYQNSFSFGPTTRYDIQLGITFSGFKFGNRFRYILGKKDQYGWITTNTNSVLKKNFYGTYEKKRWAKISDEYINRTYANINLKKNRYMALNILLFFGIDFFEEQSILSENTEYQNSDLESFKTYIIEANPNINIKLKNRLVIDAAVLLEYAYTRYENLYQRYNNIIKASRMTFWDTSVYAGDEYSWENFSYADEYFFDIGFEIDASIPLYGRKNQVLALMIMLLENTKFTKTKKYFGNNENTSHDTKFNITGYRINYKREIWLHTTFSIFYKINKVHFRFDLIQPLIYSLSKSTSVLDNNQNKLFYCEKLQQLAIQEGTTLVFSIGHQI